MGIVDKIKKRFFLKGADFKSNVLKLMSGSILTQLILLLSSPLITRLYNAEEFGILSLYTAVTTIISTFITGKYELAIVQTKNKIESFCLLKIISLLGFVSIIILSLLCVIFNTDLREIFQTNSLFIIYSLPFSILSLAYISTLNYWFIRKANFTVLSISAIIQTIVTTFMQLFLGFCKIDLLSNEIGLILSQLLGQVLNVAFLMYKDKEIIRNMFFKLNDLSQIIKIGKKYIDYPKFILLANLFNKFSVYLPTIFFSIFFSPFIAGFFALAQRTIRIPMTVVGKSVSDVYFKKATDLYIEGNNVLKEKTLKMIKVMFLLGLVPTIILILFGKFLFIIVFGKDWGISGIYASILSIAILFQFVFSPLARIFHIYNKQRLYQNWELLRFIFIFILLLVSVIFKSGLVTLIFYTISLSGSYLLLGLFTVKVFKESR